MILTSAILSQCTSVTDDRWHYYNIRTLQWNCNVRLETANRVFEPPLSDLEQRKSLVRWKVCGWPLWPCADRVISTEKITSRNRIRAQISTPSRRLKYSADLHPHITFRRLHFYLWHLRLLPYICVTSISNCDIWLQIKPNLDVYLSFQISFADCTGLDFRHLHLAASIRYSEYINIRNAIKQRS